MKRVRFWGVRGSIPTPGPETIRYGGNTLCTSIELDAEHTLILDAGTGLYQLGQQALPGRHTYFILLSHVHWDHIQGLPMFHPHMDPEVSIRILCEMNHAWSDSFLSQIDGVHFPIGLSEVRADISSETGSINGVLQPFGVQISWIRLNHRGECYGYRISSEGRSLLYVTDHEMDAVDNFYTPFDELSSFCSGADFLIHDAQFTSDDMPQKAGWGHSTVERVCELAADSGVSRLFLFHHDPGRSDDALDTLTLAANEQLKNLGSDCTCEAAYEGLELKF